MTTTSLLRAACVPLLLLAPLGLASGSPGPATHIDDGRPTVVPVRLACGGKPNAGLGTLDAAVVDRPAPDRAVVEVHWRRGPRGGNAALEVMPPDGAWLVTGSEVVPLTPGLAEGTERFTLDFDRGRDLDLVVRLAVRTLRGDRSIETYVRLVSAPDSGT